MHSETELQRARTLCAESLAHDARPHFARRAKLGDLFEQIHMARAVESAPRCKIVNREPPLDCFLDVDAGQGKAERQLLRGIKPVLAHVVEVGVAGVPQRHPPRAKLDDVDRGLESEIDRA